MLNITALRGGAATLYYPIWHYEAPELIVLKNNRGVEENRIRQLDYCIQVNKLIYERIIKRGNITLFSPNDVPGMYEAFYNDQEKFEELYTKAEANESIRKRVVPAMELFTQIMQERASTGRIYLMNVDHSNTHSSFDEKVAPIHMSNLCVSGDTELLTDQGYIPIEQLAGTTRTIWNGEEWTKASVFKTGENQSLTLVETTFNKELKATPYHKWYVLNKTTGNYEEKRTHELKVGDKLIRCQYPIISGSYHLKDAYTNGFYTGDGTQSSTNRQRVYLYHEKKKLEPYITGNITSRLENRSSNRVEVTLTGLMPKLFVPDHTYTLQSRIEWLAGLFDSDGTITEGSEGIQSVFVTSIDFDFLKRVQKMLEFTGVQSKIRQTTKAGFRPMPNHKGDPENPNSDYWCKDSYRLQISGWNVQILLGLDLKCHRLKLNKQTLKRSTERHLTVFRLTPDYSVEDTYCTNEPKKNLSVFNGLLTGQCVEISLPTKPLDNILDEKGEIGLCILAAVNVTAVSKEEMGDVCEMCVRALDALIDYQTYPVRAAEISTRNRRSLGIGIINYAHFLAKNGTYFTNTTKANEITHELMELFQYSLIKASVKLAQEYGPCGWFNETKYSKGILPIDTYKKDLDDICPNDLKCDWEALRQDVLKYGMRNSTLSALMPSETSSQVANATNGIEPPRGLVSIKQSKDGILKQVVPDIKTLGLNYETAWNMQDNVGYIHKVCIMQKFVDQAISANEYYMPSRYPGGKVPMTELIKMKLLGYKYGMKTWYYHNTNDGADDRADEINAGCESGACAI